jgi:predicted glycoside hydrolase/deacetylase ChbG (UPF0249 family)
VRRLIVNADDFGLTPGVNRAIIEGHTRGAVTSATLMANASGFDDAVRLANSHPGLSIGCHVVLVDGLPVSNSSEISTLLDRADVGHFRASLSSFVVQTIRGQVDPLHVERETIAQIRKLQAARIQPSHVDTHKHAHLFPQTLRPVLRAAKSCGVRAIRNPFGRMVFSIVASRPKLWKRYGELVLLNPLARKFLRSVQAEGMITPDGSLGIAATGALDERLFRLILENLPEGTWEFVTHPGYNDADLKNVRTRLRESREAELRLLTSATTREILQRNGIQLISYRDLL